MITLVFLGNISLVNVLKSVRTLTIHIYPRAITTLSSPTQNTYDHGRKLENLCDDRSRHIRHHRSAGTYLQNPNTSQDGSSGSARELQEWCLLPPQRSQIPPEFQAIGALNMNPNILGFLI